MKSPCVFQLLSASTTNSLFCPNIDYAQILICNSLLLALLWILDLLSLELLDTYYLRLYTPALNFQVLPLSCGCLCLEAKS